MISTISVEEEAKLDAMQRVWQSNRRATSISFFEEEAERELLSLQRQNSCGVLLSRGQCPSPPLCTASVDENAIFHENKLPPQITKPKSLAKKQAKENVILDGAEIGDLPARYVIPPVESHQFPVIGVYIDKRVIPGFKYKVRPLPAVGHHHQQQQQQENEDSEDKENEQCLFEGKAKVLSSIGRGYARRLTFEADDDHLNSNDNYFWSDNRPEGYAFELELISEGDKFTIFDLDKEAQGTLEVLKLEGPQIEIGGTSGPEAVEKRVKVKMIGKVELYETGVAKPMPVAGLAIAIKNRRQTRAEITRVINVNINHHRFYLVPGVSKQHRRVTVKGCEINDVPTKYTMTGLEPFEIPVVGTYVDPRIVPGFYYRIRPNDRKERLFEGRTMKLMSIGMGYAKRLTFQPDSLVNPDNYLWSDNHPDGLGLEPRAVHVGMKFSILANDQRIGIASVFRADMPQKEEKMEKVATENGLCAIEKHIYIDVMCHVMFTANGNRENEEHLMRICGEAIARKDPKSNDSYIRRIENVGLDSQLRVLFALTHTELVFVPLTSN